jgi:hypothetical protein
VCGSHVERRLSQAPRRQLGVKAAEVIEGVAWTRARSGSDVRGSIPLSARGKTDNFESGAGLVFVAEQSSDRVRQVPVEGAK